MVVLSSTEGQNTSWAYLADSIAFLGTLDAMNLRRIHDLLASSTILQENLKVITVSGSRQEPCAQNGNVGYIGGSFGKCSQCGVTIDEQNLKAPLEA